jgi:transcription elongation factor SPT6
MRPGDTPSVLAMSWGKGDPQKDAITLVLLDEAGRLREHTKIDNLVDNELKTEFLDLLRHRKPDVIVIGGLTMATTKLSVRVKEVLRGEPAAQGENGAGVTWGSETRDANEQVFDIPVIYVLDDVARLYRNSKQAAEEFSALSPTAKYCVGLARYTQSLLNEYAALGADITAISFDEEDQLLVGLGAEIISNNSHLCRCRQKGCCSRWNEPLLT